MGLAVIGAFPAAAALVLVGAGLTEPGPADLAPRVEQFYDADVEACRHAAEDEVEGP